MWRLATVIAVCLPALALGAEPSHLSVGGAELLHRGTCTNLSLSPDHTLTLKPGAFCGTCSLTLDVPAGNPKRVNVSVINPKTPPGNATLRLWPASATDIAAQVRFRLSDGRWTEWQPRNLLRGGDMRDSDGDGIPDWVSVMHLRDDGSNLFYADTRISDWMPPKKSYWDGKTRASGTFVDAVEPPAGAWQSLRLNRPASGGGQDTAAMRLDLVPPDAELTVCGWTKYDLGNETSMGVMARFHEFDGSGNRVNKYVLLGDDDFHQPSGRSEWRWRALSFKSLPQTTFLNLYPIRMIGGKGRAWAANYEIRLGAVHSDWGSEQAIFRESFESLDGWEISGPGVGALSDKAVDGRSSLRLDPEPLKVVTATQKSCIKVEPGQLYAFRIAMQNDVPAHYEKTHQAWMSAYLEFYDKDMRFLDYCKAMAFRPTPGRPVGAAMHAPNGSRFARFMLAASHISYGDRTGMDGPMHAYFDALQLEKSDFDPAFTPRPDADIRLDVPRSADKMEVRSYLLSRQRDLRPSFAGYTIEWSAPEQDSLAP